MAAVRLAHGRFVLQVRRVGAIGLALEGQQGLEGRIGLEQEAVNGEYWRSVAMGHLR